MYEESVRDHYRQQAALLSLDEQSTMPDRVVRRLEIEAIFHTLSAFFGERKDVRILEIGCGNGVLLQRLHDAAYADVVGIDYLPEFVELARSRGLPYRVEMADVRTLPFGDATFDVVISERVIINLKDFGDQDRAFSEVRRVLPSKGVAVLIEAFEDGWINLNAARAEFGLPAIPMAGQNRWFQAGEIDRLVAGRFTPVVEHGGVVLTPRNFLSSHFFLSRVVHAMLLDARRHAPDGFVGPERNSHFASFFGTLLPPHGNYAAIQFWCMRAS